MVDLKIEVTNATSQDIDHLLNKVGARSDGSVNRDLLGMAQQIQHLTSIVEQQSQQRLIDQPLTRPMGFVEVPPQRFLPPASDMAPMLSQPLPEPSPAIEATEGAPDDDLPLWVKVCSIATTSILLIVTVWVIGPRLAYWFSSSNPVNNPTPQSPGPPPSPQQKGSTFRLPAVPPPPPPER